MEAHTFLAQLLLILVTARIFAEIAAYFQAPSVIGELMAGVLLGPSLFGWVENSEFIRLLAEIGVILLLFEVGLDTDIGKLMKVGAKAVTVAIGGFVGPFVLGFLLVYYVFGQSLMVSLFIGGTLTATSIGITVRTLTDVNRQHSREGQITLGAAVLDDILGVILLALLYEFSVSGEVNLMQTGKVLAYVSIFFLLAPILAKIMSKFIGKVDQHTSTPGLIPTTIVSLVLFFSWLAHAFGAPELLGGFAAGLALSRRFFLPFAAAINTHPDFSKKIAEQMTPIVQLFTPIFFVSVGLSLNLQDVDWSSPFFWWLSLSLLIVAIFSKFIGAFFIEESWSRRIVVGMAMVPRGEVGLIFAGLGQAAGIFNDKIYTAVVMVIAYTTLLSPFWLKFYYRHWGHKLDKE